MVLRHQYVLKFENKGKAKRGACILSIKWNWSTYGDSVYAFTPGRVCKLRTVITFKAPVGAGPGQVGGQSRLDSGATDLL